MPRTIFLHVGMPKCATTTVQYFLDQNSAWLQDAGISYVKHPEDRTTGQGNAAELASLFIHRHFDEALAMLDHFLTAEGSVVLSSEILFGAARGDAFLPFVDRVTARGFDLRVICYFRRQDLWLESDFKQHIKGSADWVDPIGALLRRRMKTHTLNYHWMMQNWERVAGSGSVTVVPLNRGQAPDYPITRFLDFLGLPDRGGLQMDVPSQNVSPATGLMEAARHVKREAIRMGLPEIQVVSAVDQFLDLAPRVIDTPPRRFLLPYETRARLLHKYAESNAKLAADHLGGATPFDPLEPDDGTPFGNPQEEATDVLAAYTLRSGPFLGTARNEDMRNKVRFGLGKLFPTRK